MSVTPATTALEAAGVVFRLHTYRSHGAPRGAEGFEGYGVEAAAELDPAELVRLLDATVAPIQG